jgi:hypothetical protein
MASYFQTPSNPDIGVPLSFKGFGVYTHAGIIAPPSNHFPPHQRREQIQFLPLGGPMRVQRSGGLQPDLPDDINKVYKEMLAVLAHEEKIVAAGTEYNPVEKFGALGIPTIGGQSPPTAPTAPTSNPPPPPPPPPMDEGYLAARRNSIISSITPELLSDGQKTRLKKALDREGWPTKYASLEGYNAPDVTKGTPWLTEDRHALQCILQNVDMPNEIIAQIFFPGRTNNSVSKKRSEDRGMYGPGSWKRRKTIDDGKWRPSSRGGEDMRRTSIAAMGADVVMGGTVTEPANAAAAASPTVTMPGATAVGTIYDEIRDPRRRGR